MALDWIKWFGLDMILKHKKSPSLKQSHKFMTTIQIDAIHIISSINAECARLVVFLFLFCCCCCFSSFPSNFIAVSICNGEYRIHIIQIHIFVFWHKSIAHALDICILYILCTCGMQWECKCNLFDSVWNFVPRQINAADDDDDDHAHHL